MRWNTTNRPVWLRYSIALLAVAIAVLARVLLFKSPGSHGPFVTFFPAVFVAAMFGGAVPGLLATAVATLYALLWWNPVPYPLAWSVLAVFSGTGVFVSFFAAALHRSETRAYEADKKASVATERQQAAIAIQESEGQWKRTFDTVPDLIAILDSSHRILKVNREMAGRIGMEPEQCIGMTCYEAMHGSNRPLESCPHLQTLEDGQEHEAQVYEERLGGFFHVSTTPLHDERGRMVGTVHVARDITESRKAEEALKESEGKLRSILGVVPVGIGLTRNRVILEANGHLCQMTGYRKAELLNAGARILYPSEEEYRRVVEHRCGRLTDKGPGAMEAVWKKKDGALINVLLSSTPVNVSDPSQGVTFTALDITEQKQAENALREKEERLRLLEDNLPDSAIYQYIHETDGRVRFLHFSAGIERLNGVRVEDVLRDAGVLQRQILPEYFGKIAETEARNAQELSDFEMEIPMRLPDGRVRWMRLHSRPRPMPDGRIVWDGVQIDVTERKQAEEALRESEREFVAMFERAAVGKALSDPETKRMIRVNRAFADMLGYSIDELCEMTFVEITHPEDRERNLAGYERVRDGSADKWQIEKRYIRKDGSVIWADVSGNVIHYEDGRPDRIIAVIQDITKRKRIEEELRKSRLELESRVMERTAELVRANDELKSKTKIIDFARDAIIIRNLEGRIAFWNKGAEETYGFSSDRVVGGVIHELLESVFPVPLEEISRRVLENGEWKGEIKHTKANGERIVVDSRWAIQLGQDGQPVGFLEVNRDITAKKVSDEELRKADRAFRTLSEFNQTLVRQTDEMELLRQACRIVADVGGYRLVWVGLPRNDEEKTVLPIASAGYSVGYLSRTKITWGDDETGRGPCGVSIRTGKPSISQNFATNPAFAPWRLEAAKNGLAASISLPLIVEGNVIAALVIYASEPDAFDQAESNLLNDLAQNLSYGISSIRSDEKRRKSEEALRVYASRLELINRELQEFAFVAAHDLQEPLRKIQTFCDMAMKRCITSLDVAGQEYLDKAINSASRMRNLLYDMLQFSRVAANPEPFKEIDLTGTVREAADVFETSIQQTGCQVIIENMPRIEADASQLSRLFQNLFENALKFRSHRTPCIKVYNKSETGEFCEICVEDNGIGFDQQFAEQIFKPFQRLHGRGRYEGTGMGLAICRKIAERHCGTINVKSLQGKGATFTVRLPVKQAAMESCTGEQ